MFLYPFDAYQCIANAFECHDMSSCLFFQLKLVNSSCKTHTNWAVVAGNKQRRHWLAVPFSLKTDDTTHGVTQFHGYLQLVIGIWSNGQLLPPIGTFNWLLLDPIHSLYLLWRADCLFGIHQDWKSMMESYAIAGAFSFILMFLALMHFTMVCNLVCCITKSSKMTCTSLWGAMQLFFPNLLWEFCFTYEAHGPYQIWVASNVSCFIKMW
jgi:hypothetical protein